jgi:predicted regulator of Ras-like GTPase activity (Roadblock/LC7/MglB family)
MGTLPQLIEEDIQQLDQALREFNANADATAALIIDKGGFLITHQGDSSGFDLTTISALASGAFMANQTIAGLVRESNFNSIYQQGENHSLFVMNVDESCLLVVIFKAESGVGVVKYYATDTVKDIARQIKIAHQRAPGEGLDLSVLNMADPSGVFKRKK